MSKRKDIPSLVFTQAIEGDNKEPVAVITQWKLNHCTATLADYIYIATSLFRTTRFICF